jgi:hypothetical protein
LYFVLFFIPAGIQLQFEICVRCAMAADAARWCEKKACAGRPRKRKWDENTFFGGAAEAPFLYTQVVGHDIETGLAAP